jgi:hypothetical protein
MRDFRWVVPICLAVLAGCDASRDPIPANANGTAPEGKEGAAGAADSVARPFIKTSIPAPPKGPEHSYQGKNAKQWGDVLASADRNNARTACWALKILGAEGRPHLLHALENSKPHIRRTALESLSVSEIRAHGEHGRDLLVHLAGDHDDPCIRERACLYLMQWREVLPAP